MSQDEAKRSAIAKAGRRLLPFLCLCYAVNFLDRVNVGFAALAMNEDLGFSPSIFGAGAGIFFVGYLLFEIPSNLALQHFGARIWIARIMVSWGLVAIAMALVSGTASFYAMRFLLGVAEAGFFPGIILYLTYWFPAHERARIVSLFMAAVPLATLVGGPVSGALLELHGLGGLKGWHWLFIVEGVPAVLLGLAALKLLPDRPADAPWLSEDEKHALEAKLAAEAATTRDVGYHALGDALTKPRVFVLALLYFCIVVGLYGIGFWMPQVIQTFGLMPLEIGFLTAVPYLFASIAMVIWGRHSDATGERVWHVALPLFLRRRGLRLVGSKRPARGDHGGVSIAAIGIYAAVSTFWSLPTAILTGTGAAAGLALVNSVGNLGGLAGPSIVGAIRQATGSFTAALLFLAAAMALGGIIVLLFGQARRWGERAVACAPPRNQ
jgi:ACS family tartrate transporter-like MFS transporter